MKKTYLDEFLAGLPEDNLESLDIILTEALHLCDSQSNDMRELLPLYGLYCSTIIELEGSVTSLGEDAVHKEDVCVFFKKQYTRWTTKIAINKRNIKLSNPLNSSDKDQIQTLVNQLRDTISKSLGVADDHRLRILEKLESLQRELNKPISNFDSLISRTIQIIDLGKRVGINSNDFVKIGHKIYQLLMNSESEKQGLPPGEEPPLALEETTDETPEE